MSARIDREAFAQPVSEDGPSGPWLRRDGTYALVQEALRSEDGDPAYGIPEKRPDWGEAERVCHEALSGRTRDFYLATMLTEALVHTRGAQGLADGLWLIATLHEMFWADFHPQPRDEGANIDGRLNQLDALIRSFARILDAVPTDEAGELSYADWRHAGGKLPGGGDSPLPASAKADALGASSWEFIDGSARAMTEAAAELRRLDDLVDQRYSNQAPSLGELREALDQAVADFDGMLQSKGPGPFIEQAQQVLQQTGAAFVDLTWLSEHFRNGVPLPRILNSVEAACSDERAGLTPEEGWPALLDTTWSRGDSYERRSEPEPTPVAPEVRSDAAEAPSTSAEAPAAAQQAAPPAPVAPAPAFAAPVSGDALGALVAACRALRQTDPSQPIAFLALRQLRWAETWHLEAGATPAGPGDALRQQLAGLFEQAEWASLLEACEQALEQPESAAWLDLQRYACAAMRQLGLPWADRPREEVLLALGAFIGRHPWLPSATLADGGPAADEITRNWLNSEVTTSAPASAPAADATATASDSPDDGISELAEARQLVESEGLAAAVALLHRAADNTANPRRRVLLQIGLGELCLRNEHEEIALPVLEDACRALQESRPASHWEGPQLLARSLEALYQGYTLSEAKEATDETRQRKRAVADELARIDPARRLSLGS